MKVLAYLAETFIATFGITEPAPEQKKLTHLVLGGFLLAFILGVLGLLGFLVYAAL